MAAAILCAGANSAFTEEVVPVRITGMGRMSCAHWQSTSARLSEGGVWLYGFWTALNYVAATNKLVESKIDAEAIMAEVQKTCASRPSQDVATAAWKTWGELTKSIK